jgi:hypothetical protein
VFTARYALSPYIKQICFVFKGLIKNKEHRTEILHSVTEAQEINNTFMLFISVHMINIAKQIQLMHNIVYLFIFYSSFPLHFSSSNYANIKGAISKLHKMCITVTIK